MTDSSGIYPGGIFVVFNGDSEDTAIEIMRNRQPNENERRDIEMVPLEESDSDDIPRLVDPAEEIPLLTNLHSGHEESEDGNIVTINGEEFRRISLADALSGARTWEPTTIDLHDAVAEYAEAVDNFERDVRLATENVTMVIGDQVTSVPISQFANMRPTVTAMEQ